MKKEEVIKNLIEIAVNNKITIGELEKEYLIELKKRGIISEK